MFYKIIKAIIKIKKYIWNVLGIDPISKIFKFIDKKLGGKYEILELFGGTGKLNTIYYQNKKSVNKLVIYEILSSNCNELKKNCPNAVIKNVDTFSEIERCTEKFDIIISDNTPTLFGEYCEHFEIFPKIFRVAKDRFAVIFNIILDENDVSKSFYKIYPTLFSPEHLERREKFYGVSNSTNLNLQTAIQTYKKIGETKGYILEDFYLIKRGRLTFVYFLALIFSKSIDKNIHFKSNNEIVVKQ